MESNMRVRVDSRTAGLVATGIVSPAELWEPGPDGRNVRVPGGQARNDAGLPQWQVEMMRSEIEFGRPKTVVEQVTIPATAAPELTPMAPVQFEVLTVSVSPRRDGKGLSVRWEADGITAAVPAKRGGE